MCFVLWMRGDVIRFRTDGETKKKKNVKIVTERERETKSVGRVRAAGVFRRAVARRGAGSDDRTPRRVDLSDWGASGATVAVRPSDLRVRPSSVLFCFFHTKYYAKATHELVARRNPAFTLLLLCMILFFVHTCVQPTNGSPQTARSWRHAGGYRLPM